MSDHKAHAQSPLTIEERIARLGSGECCTHANVDQILQETASFATHPQAQQFIAKAALWKMDRNHQGTWAGNVPFSNPHADYKPSLMGALTALVEAGVVTPENLNAELSAAISQFRNRYSHEVIPQSLQPIYDAVPKASITDRLQGSLSLPKKDSWHIAQ